MRQVRRTALSIAAAQVALFWAHGALAQTPTAPQPAASAPAGAKPREEAPATIVVQGRRAALASSQKIKQDADEVVDSIVADEIGKLPDRSVTEVLQRVVGVTIDRTMARKDPEHYSVEGSGVNIRGLSFVRSELNGRDTFSANGGRALNFEDVPPELMSGVDIYKNPSAVQIEGAIGGLVNLRTAMPLDFAGAKASMSLQGTYSEAQRKWSPSGSGLVSNRWNTDFGQFGALLSLAHSVSNTRTDYYQVEPYFKIDPDGAGPLERNYWVPKGAQWRTLEFERTRDGLYGALQWKRDNVESSLTYFKSKYKMHWDENAIFAQSDAWNIAVDGGVYNANNALQQGTLREAVMRDGGISFGADTRYQDRDSSTQDLGWNLRWKLNDRWTVSTDLQLVRSKTQSFDSTVATGLLMPKENLDLSGSIPRLRFDSSDLAAFNDPSKYFWAFTMDHRDRSKAESKSWRTDAKYSFDHPVLNDLQFGIRLADREATTLNSMNPAKAAYNWAAITQPWMRGWYLDNLARLSDPRFSDGTYLHQFNNFFGGKFSVPGLYMPTVAMAQGYPDSYAKLHTYSRQMCAEKNGGNIDACNSFWTPSTFGVDPAGTNDQEERTQAAYAQLRFGFDDLKYPVDGNLGVRVVRTKMSSAGYLTFNIDGGLFPQPGQVLGGVPVPALSPFAAPITFSQTYTDTLPSLNLKMKVSPELQFRLGLAKAIARPDFADMQAYSTMTMSAAQKHSEGDVLVIDRLSFTGRANGNPALKPVRSTQLDLTGEWYFSKNGSLTVALFNKDLKDVIVNQTTTAQLADASGTLHDFTVTSPVNGAKGHARGIEVAFQRYFDMLPGWLAGIGVQANYTYIDSQTKPYNSVYSPTCSGTATEGIESLNRNINGCDTDGRSFGNLPLQNLSRHNYNLAVLYDQGSLSARLAYSWRSKYLQGVNVNGTNGTDGRDDSGAAVAWALPTWNDDYGQLDGGVTYRFNDQLSFSLEGSNLTNRINRQLMQQNIGMMTRAVHYTGRRYTLQASYTF
ncbi:TonB-dependent receptor [Aquincola sp. S2]|uniref:TonB-dependent receptor n=1 Tax=Pseudaquabacterium terrae TaxID=2732868 RepID=A0ABX2ET68_9BURK|nr:TonB-dependent receptor [Aquabacterium terrae]NRF71695.1 TonB-dependent receptor [Aquabacterium terrae]